MTDSAQRTELHTEEASGNGRPVPTSASGIAALPRLLRRLQTIHLFRNVLQDEVGQSYVGLLELLSIEDSTQPARTALLSAYAHLFSLLARDVELHRRPLAGDPWQDHLLDRLVADENPFSLKAQHVAIDAMGPSLVKAARHDLKLLHSLYAIDGAAVLGLLRERLGDDVHVLVPWDALRPLQSAAEMYVAPLPAIKTKLSTEPDWDRLIEELMAHYAASGTGIFARFWAFRWLRQEGTGRLEGIGHPDPISLDELVEYDLERQLLLQNTEQFVAGFPANNALLYGDRGTGKSSTVKALLHRYGPLGLRLVEVPKSLLGDFPRILALLRGRRERFVLFVDDLSFDEKETGYKELKAALEGNVEARPDNVVLYATSNRRHLIQENYSDRASGDGELRRWDTHQEKLSLADRFGITVVFTTPDQERYLRIVQSLVSQRGLEIDPDSLRAKALRWATQQGGFSGRAARQFVDFLAGEIGLAALR